MTVNKFNKYLLYAIGEVILVVIGILMALSINNWYEGRKESILEFQTLSGLYNDISNNKIKIDNMISRESIIISGNQHILSLLQDDNLSFNDSLQFSFGNLKKNEVF